MTVAGFQYAGATYGKKIMGLRIVTCEEYILLDSMVQCATFKPRKHKKSNQNWNLRATRVNCVLQILIKPAGTPSLTKWVSVEFSDVIYLVSVYETREFVLIIWFITTFFFLVIFLEPWPEHCWKIIPGPFSFLSACRHSSVEKTERLTTRWTD